MHRELSRVLDISPARIRVIQPPVGAGFGGKSEPFDLEFCVAVLAKKTGRPVKILYTREEEFYAHRGRHPAGFRGCSRGCSRLRFRRCSFHFRFRRCSLRCHRCRSRCHHYSSRSRSRFPRSSFCSLCCTRSRRSRRNCNRCSRYRSRCRCHTRFRSHLARKNCRQRLRVLTRRQFLSYGVVGVLHLVPRHAAA